MIEKERIERIKSAVDLKDYIEQATGNTFQKNGKGYVCRCPFPDHDDSTPSFVVTPKENLWHCFGCNRGGDIFQFDHLYFQLDFPASVQKHEGGSPEPQGPQAQPPDEARIRQHLARAAGLYARNLSVGGEYLSRRGLCDMDLLSRHQVGYCGGNLQELLPTGGPLRDELAAAGLLLASGRERFKDCIVVPVFDADGNILTLYGRHTGGGVRRHVFLPGRKKGLWNAGVIKTHAEVILTESILDALSVMTAGLPNAIALNGVAGPTEKELLQFAEYGVQRILLLLDGDAAGRKAAADLRERLNRFSVAVRELPEGHDPNSYLAEHGPDALLSVIRTPAMEPPEACGLTVTCGPRSYRVIDPEKGPRRLRATLRVTHAGKLYTDTLDLYAARARKSLAQDLCRLFAELPETIEADISRILAACEKETARPVGEDAPPSMSPAEQAAAEAFGKSPDLIERILADFEACGLVGEEENKLLCYIAMTSRKRKAPLAVLILAGSGAGKTALQDAVADFCPPEDLVKLTSLSGKALFYKDRLSLQHKLLALEEGDGAAEAAYAIRNLISSGALTIESTIKDPSTGKLTTMENRVEGPTAVFYTTTDPATDPETKSRFFVTGVDESRQQTRRILAFQRKRHLSDDGLADLEKQAILRKHHHFQRLLKPLVVQNAYSDRLTYGDDRLQGRRDQPKYLNLIKATAFLRQLQKPVRETVVQGRHLSCIAVDPTDIAIANRLFQAVTGKSLDDMSRPGRDLLAILAEMTRKDAAAAFTRRTIREFSGWSNTRVHRYLKELIDLEYVLVESGRNGSRYHYRLAYDGRGLDGEKFVLGLTPADRLKA